MLITIAIVLLVLFVFAMKDKVADWGLDQVKGDAEVGRFTRNLGILIVGGIVLFAIFEFTGHAPGAKSKKPSDAAAATIGGDTSASAKSTAGEPWSIEWDNHSTNDMSLLFGDTSVSGTYTDDAGEQCPAAGSIDASKALSLYITCPATTWHLKGKIPPPPASKIDVTYNEGRNSASLIKHQPAIYYIPTSPMPTAPDPR